MFRLDALVILRATATATENDVKFKFANTFAMGLNRQILIPANISGYYGIIVGHSPGLFQVSYLQSVC